VKILESKYSVTVSFKVYLVWGIVQVLRFTWFGV